MDRTLRSAKAPSVPSHHMLFPIMAFVFVGYLVIGIALPVVPLYVRNELGLSNFVVGLVAGSPFLAALLSRLPAGRYSDRAGAKRAVVTGMLSAVVGGVLFFISLAFFRQANVSVAILLVGRALLGVADSFVITGALSWGLKLLGAEHTGRVMAWVGTSLYAAFALGAPLGSALYASHGFNAIAVATILIPLCALGLLAPLSVAKSSSKAAAADLISIARAVWAPGVALALSGVGFAALMAFLALLFVDHHWAPVWSAFSVLSLSFIVGRVLFGGLADKVGGARVAFVCVLVEAAGLFLIGVAPSMAVALTGVALSSFGYSLVYPGLGVEAIKYGPSQSRGVTMGAYTACLDLSLGISSPVLGVIASAVGMDSVYLVSGIVALLAGGLTLRLWLRKRILPALHAHRL